MMIFLTILKIIGLVLLSLLGLVLLILLLVLFVPLRYKIAGSFDKKPLDYNAFAQVTWLLGLINVNAVFDKENGLEPCLKVAGFKLYPRKHDGSEEFEEADYDGLYEETCEEHPQETQMETSPSDVGKTDEDKAEEETGQASDETSAETAEEGETRTSGDDRQTEEEVESSSDSCTALDSQETYTEYSYSDLEDGIEDDKEDEHHSKIGRFAKFIQGLIEKAVRAFENISYTIESLYDKIKRIVEKIEYYKAWWEAESTQTALHKVISQVGVLLRAIRPRRLSLGIIYGDADPSTTGKMYGNYAAVSPWIGRWVSVEPRFEEDILKCDLDARGRLQIYILVIIAWKLYFDKNLRRVIRRFKNAPQ